MGRLEHTHALPLSVHHLCNLLHNDSCCPWHVPRLPSPLCCQRFMFSQRHTWLNSFVARHSVRQDFFSAWPDFYTRVLASRKYVPDTVRNTLTVFMSDGLQMECCRSGKRSTKYFIEEFVGLIASKSKVTVYFTRLLKLDLTELVEYLLIKFSCILLQNWLF